MIPWESCKLWLGYPLQNGVWPDVSKHDNDGVITGAVWGGDSLEFDGVDDCIDCGADSTLDITEEISLEALFRPYSYPTEYTALIYRDDNLYLIQIRTAEQKALFYATPHAKLLWTASVIPLNVWTHLMVCYDGTTARIYFNGKEENSYSDTRNLTASDTAKVHIGCYHNVSHWFDGDFALARIYNKGLTAAQVQEAYEQCYRKV